MIPSGRAVVEGFVARGHVFGVPVESESLLRLADDPSKFTRREFDPGHYTASAVLVDPRTGRLLLVYHPKLECWLQPGGHFEPSDVSVAAAAAREAGEETGCRVHARDAIPVALEIHRIPRWRDEPAHLHLDLRFLFEISEDTARPPAELEARWFSLGSSVVRSALGSTLERVYRILGSRRHKGSDHVAAALLDLDDE